MTSQILRHLGAVASALASLPFLVAAWGAVRHRQARTGAYRFGVAATSGAALVLVATLAQVAEEVGHAPFQTIHEILLYGSLCALLAYLAISASLRLHAGNAGTLGVGAALGFTTTVFTAIVAGPVATSYGYDRLNLPPALQSSFFVPHVVVYIFGYGAAAVATLAATLHLCVALTSLRDRSWGPAALENLDELSYRTVGLAFPFLTFGLAMGTAWAWYAWANFWGWDNKEVWALITWLTYLVYLHLRLMGGMRGVRASAFLVLGGVCVWVTLLLFGYLPASTFSAHRYSM